MLARFLLSYLVSDYKYDYWHCPHLHSSRVAEGDYFIDFSPKTEYPGPLDERGIPLLELSSQHWSSSRETVYSPIIICQYALGWYSRYLSGRNPQHRERFLAVADWLLSYVSVEERSGIPLAVFYTNYGHGNVRSAMAQGLAISVWCRAFRETKRDEYVEKAVLAFNTCMLSVDDGGVADTANGLPILQEWTDSRVHIYNGHLFGFAGMHDLLRTESRLVPMPEVAKTYEMHLRSSLTLTRLVDLGWWTRYSLRKSLFPNIASRFYHLLHIEMAKGMYQLTDQIEFLQTAQRWRRQDGNPALRILALAFKLLDRFEVEASQRLLRGRTES